MPAKPVSAHYPVRIRLVGTPDDVERIVAALPAEWITAGPSRPYEARRATDHIRVYLEVSPE